MKIKVLKKGSKVKMTEPCPWLLEVPPEAAK
jgi:hypothetical protein